MALISSRISDDLYKKLKAYADSIGSNVSDVVRDAVEKFLAVPQEPPASQPAPQPAPPPEPSPTPTPPSPQPPTPEPQPTLCLEAICKELDSLREFQENMRIYIEEFSARFNVLQQSHNNLIVCLSALVPLPGFVPFPPFPPPPWSA